VILARGYKTSTLYMITNIRDTVNEAFGHMFWDDQNRKIIRSRKISFNEQVVYKDRSSVELVCIKLEFKKSEFVNLDELSESIVRNKVQEHEALTDSQKGKQIIEVELDEQHSPTNKGDDKESSRDSQH
jgi:hypothetical protein